jgi:hypothetical protein
VEGPPEPAAEETEFLAAGGGPIFTCRRKTINKKETGFQTTRTIEWDSISSAKPATTLRTLETRPISKITLPSLYFWLGSKAFICTSIGGGKGLKSQSTHGLVTAAIPTHINPADIAPADGAVGVGYRVQALPNDHRKQTM